MVERASGRGKARRRLGHLGRTVRARRHRGAGPAPTDDRGWAAVLSDWVDRQARILTDDVAADLAGRPAPCPDVVGRARRLWSLAHLRRHGLGGEAVVGATAGAWEALERHADEEHGGYLWSFAPDGTVTNGQKLLYGQCVAVHALSEVALADPERAPRALAAAEATLALAAERVTPAGTLCETLDRSWAPLPPGTSTEMGIAGTVTIGSQLHLVEAAALLVAAGGGPRARDVADRAADTVRRRFLDAEAVAWTDEDGHPLRRAVSLGHEVEAAWLLADSAEVLGLEGERERCRRHVDEVLAAGFRHGGLNDEPWPGFRLGGQQRIWWVQVELLRALVEVDEGPDGPTRRTLRELLGWLHRAQVDPGTGQAWQLMTHWGIVVVTGEGTSARAGYHDLRAYVAAAGLLAGP